MKKFLLAFIITLLIFSGVLLFSARGIFMERLMYKELVNVAGSGAFCSLADNSIRSALQTIARKHLFDLQFSEMYIKYSEKKDADGVLYPLEIGYNLRVPRSLIGARKSELLAVRLVSVKCDSIL